MESTSAHNLYYTAEDIDDHGIERFASRGETSYLDSYTFRKGTFAPGTDILEMRFGSISLGHGADRFQAAKDCDRMLVPRFRQGTLKGKLRHFPGMTPRDASGWSYCAVADLSAGNAGLYWDLFLDVDG